MATNPTWRTITEACEYLGVSVPTLREMRRTGQLRYVQVGRRVRFTDEHLAEFVERNTFPRTVVLTVLPGGKREVA